MLSFPKLYQDPGPHPGSTVAAPPHLEFSVHIPLAQMQPGLALRNIALLVGFILNSS